VNREAELKPPSRVACSVFVLLGAWLVSRQLGASMENISNPSHDVPADGQTKTDAQKCNNCCNAPQYYYYRSVCSVVGLAQLTKVISPP
jgi:hypothetical protein